MNTELIERSVRRTDFLRRLPGPGARKEWMHFCTNAAGLDVMVNFSISDAVDAPSGEHRDVARVVVMVVDGDRVVGEVDSYAHGRFEARAGAVSVRAGPHHMRFVDGVFHVHAVLDEPAVEVDLVMRPTTLPAVVQNLPLEGAAKLHWLIVPRLVANGVVRLGDRVVVIADAPAYHDHNWGRFRWGEDLSWEWGFALPDRVDNPWSLVFARLTDRARHHVRMQAVMLWRGGMRHELIRDEALTTHWSGYLSPERVWRIPRVMGLLMPERGTDVPRRLELRGACRNTDVTLEFDPTVVAQVLVPNDADLGRTVIHECCGPVRVRGSVRGEPMAWEGRGFFEFLGA